MGPKQGAASTHHQALSEIATESRSERGQLLKISMDNQNGSKADTGKAALFDENDEDDEDYAEQQQELPEDEDEEEAAAPPVMVEPTMDDRKAMLAKLVAKKKREAVSTVEDFSQTV